MTVKKCPHCAENIKAEATVCPHCRRKQPLPPEARSKRRLRNVIIGLVLVAVSVTIFLAQAAGYYAYREDIVALCVARVPGMTMSECREIDKQQGTDVIKGLLPGPVPQYSFWGSVDRGLYIMFFR